MREFMAETAASLNGEPMASERQAIVRQFMSQHNVGFIGEFDPRPDNVAYECVFDCSQCLGRVGLSVSCEVAEVQLPPGCPKSDNLIEIISSEEAARLII